eukprot:CAMPEP_0197527564 /NCGR_PEP_ID=MMETSP1318-20131121/22140_1 /TAXON_ID=552666 /ORGANISM="Partenskyella glossopodia, Strain RCC365" /LENGTH=598 /DNA_ID=CAMNT_0043082287 /DNA_START=97 /DNA_END=1893 /DNA_ORIENTATION=+
MGRKDRGRKKLAAEKAKRKAAQEAKRKGNKTEVVLKKVETKDSYRSVTGVLTSRKLARDIKIGSFSLISWGNELIMDSDLELTIGRRYGLIGRNGSGKSEFLKCIANREVPIPDWVDLFLLSEEQKPSEKTAMEIVIGKAESEIARLEKLSEDILEEEGPDSPTLQDIYDRMEQLDPSTFKARAGKILRGLGFGDDMMGKATKDMSGGWRMRVSLAEALFIKPALMLLDEPTNHLDLESCVWLEQYLATECENQCLMIVSHSQDFLNGTCTNTCHITPKRTLKYYGGNYDTFIQVKAENEVNQMKQYEKQQADIKKIKQFIASAGTYSNLVKQAKSKQKILDKMKADGLIEKPELEAHFRFDFPKCERLPSPVLALNDVGFAYSGEMKDALYRGVNCGVDMDSCVALVGPNGAGKSTLLKLFCGDLTPTQGEIKRHLNLTFGRYHQHSVEQLDTKKTALEFVPSQFPDVKLEEQGWRAHLGRFGISGKLQKSPIGKLSDGQRTRIVFSMLALQRPNMIILDEPTNHLDMESIDSLADAINRFDGGVFLVSHDFRLIDQVAKEIWICDNKTISTWKGTIQSYKAMLVKRAQEMLKKEAE